MTFLSRTFAWIFFPFFIPVYLVFICVLANPYVAVNLSSPSRLLLLIVLLLNAVALPLIVIFLMRRFEIIRDLELKEKNDRNAALAVTGIFLYAAFYILKELGFHSALQTVLLGCIFSILILFLLNFRWQTSIYMTGAGNLMGALVSLSQFFLLNLGAFEITVLLFSGVLGTTRLVLGKHSPTEVYAGFLCGLLSQMLIFQLV